MKRAIAAALMILAGVTMAADLSGNLRPFVGFARVVPLTLRGVSPMWSGGKLTYVSSQTFYATNGTFLLTNLAAGSYELIFGPENTKGYFTLPESNNQFALSNIFSAWPVIPLVQNATVVVIPGDNGINYQANALTLNGQTSLYFTPTPNLPRGTLVPGQTARITILNNTPSLYFQ